MIIPMDLPNLQMQKEANESAAVTESNEMHELSEINNKRASDGVIADSPPAKLLKTCDTITNGKHEVLTDNQDDTCDSKASDKSNPLSIDVDLKNSFKNLVQVAVTKVSTIESNTDLASPVIQNHVDKETESALLSDGVDCEFSDLDDDALLDYRDEKTNDFNGVKNSISSIIESNVLESSQSSQTSEISNLESANKENIDSENVGEKTENVTEMMESVSEKPKEIENTENAGKVVNVLESTEKVQDNSDSVTEKPGEVVEINSSDVSVCEILDSSKSGTVSRDDTENITCGDTNLAGTDVCQNEATEKAASPPMEGNVETVTNQISEESHHQLENSENNMLLIEQSESNLNKTLEQNLPETTEKNEKASDIGVNEVNENEIVKNIENEDSGNKESNHEDVEVISLNTSEECPKVDEFEAEGSSIQPVVPIPNTDDIETDSEPEVHLAKNVELYATSSNSGSNKDLENMDCSTNSTKLDISKNSGPTENQDVSEIATKNTPDVNQDAPVDDEVDSVEINSGVSEQKEGQVTPENNQNKESHSIPTQDLEANLETSNLPEKNSSESSGAVKRLASSPPPAEGVGKKSRLENVVGGLMTRLGKKSIDEIPSASEIDISMEDESEEETEGPSITFNEKKLRVLFKSQLDSYMKERGDRIQASIDSLEEKLKEVRATKTGLTEMNKRLKDMTLEQKKKRSERVAQRSMSIQVDPKDIPAKASSVQNTPASSPRAPSMISKASSAPDITKNATANNKQSIKPVNEPSQKNTVKNLLHEKRKNSTNTSPASSPVVDLTEDDDKPVSPQGPRKTAVTSSATVFNNTRAHAGVRPGTYLLQTGPAGNAVLLATSPPTGKVLLNNTAVTSNQVLVQQQAQPQRPAVTAIPTPTAPATEPKQPVKTTARKRTGPRKPSQPEVNVAPEQPKKTTARKRTFARNPSPEKRASRSPSPDIVITTVTTPAPARQHPAPLPVQPTSQSSGPHMKALPPKPQLKISRVNQGIVLSWNMSMNEKTEDISTYQLYAYQETSAAPSPTLWKKVGDVRALALPMACTLTQFQEGNKYHFAVRAMDKHKRVGVFSDPCSIHLTK